MPEDSSSPGSIKRLTKKEIARTLLLEAAWEVVNQVGGIYTVLRSKAPTMTKKWGNNYCLIGPYLYHNAISEFDPIEQSSDPFFQSVLKMRELGYEVHYGHWLVTGRPRAILLNQGSIWSQLADIKYRLWEKHGISTPGDDQLVNNVVAFGELVRIFLSILTDQSITTKNVVAHFHEWMAGSGLADIKRDKLNVTTVFTTHATLLGRYLAMNDPQFYDHLPFLDWVKEANHFNIQANVGIERAAAHSCDIFTTVSEVTAKECKHLIGRTPDVVLPNGINNQRFEVLHEFQNLHQEYKLKIHQFTMAHFFQSYTFSLDKTLYFFTSGRYEYLNKGYDLTLEALARLNQRLRDEKSDVTVVMFFITRKPYHVINPQVLESRAKMEELHQTIEAIKEQVGEGLFFQSASNPDPKLPNLNNFVDDYWKLRFRRMLQNWKSDELPSIITHNLHDDQNDPILNFLRGRNLVNNESDRVKVVYHPDFINYTNPLFGIEYSQFVRGCHLGVFPSYYEPWGYTPLECIASGVPTITSDLAGFGDYVMKNVKDRDRKGIYVIRRMQKSFEESANQLARKMHQFIRLRRRERIELRNRTEASSPAFDWENLTKYYDTAYRMGLEQKSK
ncbi:MAG TPA: glycosyltransferase [Cyclobacteriaceae bacterium]